MNKVDVRRRIIAVLVTSWLSLFLMMVAYPVAVTGYLTLAGIIYWVGGMAIVCVLVSISTWIIPDRRA
jgi:hypothetical protein